MSDVYTDFLGQQVRVGDLVVYATTSGRSPVQKCATVENIESEEIVNFRTGKSRTVFKIGVKEVSNGRNFTRWDGRRWDSEKRQYIERPNGVRTTYPMPQNIVRVSVPDPVTSE
jgi:hypothetical protein